MAASRALKATSRCSPNWTRSYSLAGAGGFIVDDNFIGNKRNVKRLLPELVEWSERHHYPFSFVTEASVNLADNDDLLEGMRRTGFRRVFLGIETPVKASLKEAQKGQNTRRDLLESVKKIQSHGLEVMAGFIEGILPARTDSLKRVEQHMPEPRRGSLASELAALARVILSLGVRDSERGEFWRYMREVTPSHRDKFPQAVMLAELGYHFPQNDGGVLRAATGSLNT